MFRIRIRHQSFGRLFAQCLLIAFGLSVFEVSAVAVPRIALISLGETETGRFATERLAAQLNQNKDAILIDLDRAGAAARGVGYKGSLNLTIDEARNLGAAIDCDFFIVGDADTLRRSGAGGDSYYEAYVSLFIVDAKTGRLGKWYRPRLINKTSVLAEQALLQELNTTAMTCVSVVNSIYSDDRVKRNAIAAESSVYEVAPDDDKVATEKGIRLPQPYRRIRPVYPHSAAEADAEGIVDLLVDIDVHGEVANIDVIRWAGFGLDEAAVDTVRQLHFRPATRNGSPFPIRVLLRYNFLKPAPSKA